MVLYSFHSKSVRCLDEADGAALGAHDQARGERAAGREAHTAHKVAVAHACGGEEDLLAAAEVLGV